jgi:hypothetical protein
MPNQIGDDWRAWTTLWQFVFVAGDLSQDSSHLRSHREILVLDKEPAYASKVDTSEEVLQVNVENVPSSPVFRRIRHDRTLAFKSVRDAVRVLVVVCSVVGFINLLSAVLKQKRESLLD